MIDFSELSNRELTARAQAKKRLAWARAFVEPHIKDASRDLDAESLLPNHIFCLGSYALTQLKVKSRKIADSWGMALYAVAQAATSRSSQINIGSYDEDEAKNKLDFIEWIYEVLPVGERRELGMSKGTQQKRFNNGSNVNLLTRKAPTGGGGDYLGDEFSVEPKGRVSANEILTAALGALTHKGSVRLTGTQRGEDTTFYKIWSGEWQREMLENPIFGLLPNVEWEVGEFPWWESPALCTDVEAATRLAPAMATPERVVQFGNAKLQQQFVIYLTTPGLGLPIFQREFELKVVAEGDQYFELDDLQSCYPRRDEPYWFQHVEIKGTNYRQDSGLIQPALTLIDEMARAVKMGIIRGEFGFGMDIGRDQDPDEICIGHSIPEDRYTLCLRAVISLHDMPFEGKRRILEHLLGKPNLIVKGAIDGTKGSLGYNLAEDFEVKYGQRAQGVVFTNGIKQILATGVKTRVDQRKLTMPWCPRPDSPDFTTPGRFTKLQSQMLALKRTESAAGVIHFDVARTSAGHGDCFWATALWNHLYPPQPDAGSQEVIVIGKNGGRIGAGHRPKYGQDVNRQSRLWVPQGKVIR